MTIVTERIHHMELKAKLKVTIGHGLLGGCCSLRIHHMRLKGMWGWGLAV